MQLATTKSIVRITLLAAVFAVVFSAPSVYGAVGLPEELLDHYKVYRVAFPFPSGASVILEDQFGRSNHIVSSLEKFSVTAAKNPGPNQPPIVNPEAHLSWWTINDDGNTGVRRVVASHQFGEHELTTGKARYLLAPAAKNQPLPPQLPILDHFKCYDATGPGLVIDITLLTQFPTSPSPEHVRILDPVYFCNPTSKEREGEVNEILQPAAHLVCYKIIASPSSGITVQMSDQFLFNAQLILAESELLCIPAFKDQAVPVDEESTWGKLKSTYR